MHELSIAERIVSIATSHADGRAVSKVEVKVGHLRQVVPSALEFAFELLTEGTPIDGARLELEVVPAAGICRSCGTETELSSFPLHCSRCGGFDLEVIRGEELLVEALELEEALTMTGGTRDDG
jgi:hydrogenase nickel incorporation protein HypA/HybF